MTELPELLFISNLFPDQGQPYRGLDNATILHGLREFFTIRVISPRPALRPQKLVARHCDEVFSPRFLTAPYLPRIGSSVNHRIMELRLRPVIRQLCEERRPAVVLSSWLFPDGAAVAACCSSERLPLVQITQGTDAHAYLEIPARRRAILAASRCSHSIICRSENLGHRLAAAGVDNGKLRTIYNGIDPKVFQLRKQADCREALGLNPSGKIVLFVGNLLQVKNPLLLVEGFAAGSAGHPDAILILVGQGKMKAAIQAMAKKCNVAGRLRFTGPQTSAEIANWMGAADMLCISSRAEGLPNVLLEALASGLPVVSTEVGGIGEVLRAPDFGRLVPEGDLAALSQAIAAQLGSRADRGKIAACGGQFTWQNTILAYRDLLLRAAGISPVSLSSEK